MALFGWLLGLVVGAPLPVAIVSGALLGLLGLRPLKVPLGILVGAAPARCWWRSTPRPAGAGGGRGHGRLPRGRGLRVPPAAAGPGHGRGGAGVGAALRRALRGRSRYVGADYVEQLAKVRGGTFRRNPPDVGILASLDSLDGPDFDATRSTR